MSYTLDTINISGVTGAGGFSINDTLNHEFDQGIDLRITPATGGTIVSVSQRGYGKKADLYIVSSDQDLGAELGKIITMSCLKKEQE